MKQVDPMLALKRFVQAHPNQRTAASALNISEQHLSHVLSERRKITKRILDVLGITQVNVKTGGSQ